MNAEFQECLKREKIKPFSAGPRLVAKEFRTARTDLKAAQDTLRTGNAKWATIQAYYAMFHAGRALLYAKGYRERSHYCLVVALRMLYQGTGGLAPHLIEALQRGKSLREHADYYGEFTSGTAQQLLLDAAQFLQASHRLTRTSPPLVKAKT